MGLINDYENSVNAIIDAFKKKHEFDSNDGYWIANEVGGVYDFGDTMTFDFRDILLDIKEDAPNGEIEKWQEYNLRIWSVNNMLGGVFLKDVNYRSWLKGCPRLSDHELNVVEEKWKRLVDEVSELGKTTMTENNEKDAK